MAAVGVFVLSSAGHTAPPVLSKVARERVRHELLLPPTADGDARSLVLDLPAHAWIRPTHRRRGRPAIHTGRGLSLEVTDPATPSTSSGRATIEFWPCPGRTPQHVHAAWLDDLAARHEWERARVSRMPDADPKPKRIRMGSFRGVRMVSRYEITSDSGRALPLVAALHVGQGLALLVTSYRGQAYSSMSDLVLRALSVRRGAPRTPARAWRGAWHERGVGVTYLHLPLPKGWEILPVDAADERGHGVATWVQREPETGSVHTRMFLQVDVSSPDRTTSHLADAVAAGQRARGWSETLRDAAVWGGHKALFLRFDHPGVPDQQIGALSFQALVWQEGGHGWILGMTGPLPSAEEAQRQERALREIGKRSGLWGRPY